MMTATATAEIAPDAPPDQAESRERFYRMSYETYEQIAELGMIRREEHVVLLDGILVQTMTKGPEHSSDVIESLFLLARIIPEGWHVRPEQPIALRQGLDGDSSPEPDLAIVIGRNGQYKKRHPEAAEVSVVLEIASSPAALAADRVGLRRYAHAAIPTAVIISLHDSTIHIHTEPSGPTTHPTYARIEVKRPGDVLELTLKPSVGDTPPTTVGPVAVVSFFSPDL